MLGAIIGDIVGSKYELETIYFEFVNKFLNK